jgi:hypothetical protein
MPISVPLFDIAALVVLAVLVAPSAFGYPMSTEGFPLSKIKHSSNLLDICFSKQYKGHPVRERGVLRQCRALSCTCSRSPLVADMDLLPNHLTSPFKPPLELSH